ncbi:MAG: hypothetical protein WD267_03525 [Balneolales bacterium]
MMKSSNVLIRCISLILSFLIILVSAQALPAQERPQESFNKGNFLMEQGNYYEALEVYKDIENRKVTSGPLYLNMAISYVHVDSLGLAKYYFLKAAGHSATRSKAHDGADFIDEQLNSRRGALPRLSWISLSEWIHFEIDTVFVLISGILLLNIGILFIVFAWFKATYNQLYRYTGLTFTVVGILLIFSGIVIDLRSGHYSRGVMVERQAEMRPNPVVDDDVVSMIFEGYTFTLDQSRSREHEGWKFVRLSNGLSGWIETEAIREL